MEALNEMEVFVDVVGEGLDSLPPQLSGGCSGSFFEHHLQLVFTDATKAAEAAIA